ncbi:hypothetical protein OTK49_03050 [Vibrio coralliirubri]|uniref:hypothetical protein n=1 Tax=Vibrio coralliirubri TaxID=1516159 RepID=UPI0022851AC0|nr:hypothetical protein [Vibrio coralliirubri]MCY9861493.1 hypothetical protein [Vibrio coralliirubri]
MKTINEFIISANRLIKAKSQDKITLVQAKESLTFLGSKYRGKYRSVVMSQIESVNALKDANLWGNWALKMTSLNLNPYSEQEQFELLPDGTEVSFICIIDIIQKFGKKLENGIMSGGYLYKSWEVTCLNFKNKESEIFVMS